MDVVVWLRGLGLGRYEAAFRDNEIDDAVLPTLTAEDLKDLGVDIVGHRRKLLNAIALLGAETTTKVSPPEASSALPIYPTLGDIEVPSLTTAILRKWLIRLAKVPPRARTRPGKPQQHRRFDGSEDAIRRRRSSANRTWTILRAALNHAFRDDLVASDAAWRKVKSFKGVDAARVRYLTVEQAKRFVSASDTDFRALVQAALQTGCRYSELARLEVADFNPDSGTVAIRRSKSGKARHVVLTDEGVFFFRQLAAGRASSEIMLRKANGEAWRASHQLRPMAQGCERAKIIPSVSFHALRHTWASHAVMNGVPLLVVAKNLGHADTRMVERHYGHLAPSYITDAIRAGAPKFDFELDPKLVVFSGGERR